MPTLIGNSIIQTHFPDPISGRLMAIWALVFGGGIPIGSFRIGLLASHAASGFSLSRWEVISFSKNTSGNK